MPEREGMVVLCDMKASFACREHFRHSALIALKLRQAGNMREEKRNLMLSLAAALLFIAMCVVSIKFIPEVERLLQENSVYNNTGFSYIVAQNGDIAIHPVHHSRSQTFSSLFAIINEGENDAAVARSFRESLKNGRNGVAVFSTREGEENVLCHAAMPRMGGWSVVSSCLTRKFCGKQMP